MHIHILEPENYSPIAISTYKTVGTLTTSREFPVLPKTANCLVVRLGRMLDRVFLDQLPKLQFIVSPTTGLTHVDEDYCLNRRIEILSLKHPDHKAFLDSIAPTGELAIGMMIMLVRQIAPALADVRDNGRWCRDSFRGRDLSRLKLGVIGYGRLGRKVAKFAQAFDMEVHACDPNVPGASILKDGVKPVSLPELLSTTDVVSVHAAVNETSRKLLCREMLRLMKRGAYLVNTARGEIVCEPTIAEMVKDGHLAGFATDVLANEQSIPDFAKHPLVRLASEHNVIVTPHLGGCTSDSMIRTEEYMSDFFARHLQSSQRREPVVS